MSIPNLPKQECSDGWQFEGISYLINYTYLNISVLRMQTECALFDVFAIYIRYYSYKFDINWVALLEENLVRPEHQSPHDFPAGSI